VLNRVVLIGRLTKDPELKHTPTGVATTSFTLAVDRPFKSGDGNQDVDFIPIVLWRQLAETVANYVRKGKLVAIEGRIQIRNYENNEGKRVYITEIIADNVRFLSSERSEGQGGTNTPSSNQNDPTGSQDGCSTSSNRTYASSSDPFKDDGRPIDISEDDLPF
jgi:single-strand DNA-binding protein